MPSLNGVGFGSAATAQASCTDTIAKAMLATDTAGFRSSLHSRMMLAAERTVVTGRPARRARPGSHRPVPSLRPSGKHQVLDAAARPAILVGMTHHGHHVARP